MTTFCIPIYGLQIKLNELKIIVTILFICLSVFGNILKAQQEPMYSQYMFNMLNINPAYAGNRGVNNITFLYRMQWVGIEGAPRTGTFSWDKRKPESNVGYGFQVYNDQLGIENSTGFNAFYSYRLSFSNSSLTFGLSAGALNYLALFANAQTTQSNDPLFSENINVLLPSVGLGALYASEHFYLGFSMPALLKTKSDINYNRISTSANGHYFLTTGYVLNMTDNVVLKPSVLVKAATGSPLAYDFNMNIWFQNTIGVGVSYRPNNAIVGIFEIQLSPDFRLGYSYDYLTSNLNTYNVGGSHELMLRYEFDNTKSQRILSPRYY